MSLALSTLLFEWRRYLAAVIALALAGVLMLAVSAMFIGILQSFTATIDKSRAQIIILPANSSSLGGPGGGGGALPKRVVPLIYRHPEVVEVQDLPGDFGRFYGPGKTSPSMVNIMVIDTSPNGVTLPDDFTDDMRRAIEPPYNVGVDISAVNQLGVKLGDEATINGRTVRVALIMEGYANSQAPGVVMSRQTQRLMGTANDDAFGLLMVRIKNTSEKDAKRVAEELNALADGQYKAWTKEPLAAATVKDAMSEGLLAIILGFMSVIGFVIGVVITWQTLRGAILANIKEFASLRALGVSIGQLRGVVMELSFWVGILGIAASAVLMVGITFLAKSANIPMGFELGSSLQTAFLLLIISVMSGALTLGALKKGEPADLLK
ncbi:MAG: FtsX-like permease family protein [Alphaproteobacteria bacterium]|jgi:putative ABC transport system permease protein|nr:MAG: FtsX-like permease family protein [Alphaproteobacteria bacterium]